MSSQDDLPLCNASSKSQTRPGILPQISADSPILSDGSEPGSKKRKRDGHTMEDLLRDAFTVRPYPSTGPTKPRSLQPLILLPRSQLPLSYLDPSQSSKVLPQSRLFETHIKILELEGRMGSQPMVLIARLDDGRTLYAVEREDRGLYVLCRLGTWVNTQQLKAVAAVSRLGHGRSQDKGIAVGEIIRSAETPATTSMANKFSSKKRLAIEAIQSMVKRPSINLISDPPPATPDGLVPTEQPETLPAIPHSQVPLIGDVNDDSQPTATQILDNVRAQYLDALYLSKASLAYFVKGPLSRARAAFHLDYDSTLDMHDLIAFLESLIMSSTLTDKKYRDGLPQCISLIDIHDHSAEDAATAKNKKRKSTKKMKPGKNGLYPGEEELIRRWWATHEEDAEDGGPNDSKSEIIKFRISQLRMRETQLQMIIILEVLALQPLATGNELVSGDLPGANTSTTDLVDAKDKAPKAKKPEQLTVLIDVHVDRLCIWQSVASETSKVHTEESQTSMGKITKSSDNIPRDFCVEVIAPFFAARLPEKCSIINRKLGGPVVISPPKPKLSKSASFSNSTKKPGAATKRPVPIKTRRSLKRVLTDEKERRSISAGPNRAISLMRSATMPAGTGLKREGSEVPSLSKIPSADPQMFTTNRGGIMNSKRFAQREVDLSSYTIDPNSKPKKQATIEAELKDAIAALKKPNRELAGKALADTAQQRTGAASHPRKSKKPVRNPLFQGVQITATPKANRQMDMFTQNRPGLPKVSDTDQGMFPPSSLPRIPQSSLPSKGKRVTGNPLFPSVQATPTRRSIIPSKPAFAPFASPVHTSHGFPPSSPLQVRRSSASLFPMIPYSATKDNSRQMSRLQETPIKAKPPPPSFTAHGHPMSELTGHNKENAILTETNTSVNNKETKIGKMASSIYESLGWDDADDLDELG